MDVPSTSVHRCNQRLATTDEIMRTITITKTAGTRVGLSLASNKSGVLVSSVAYSSPLYGLVHPGDIICHPNAAEIAKHCTTASTLTLNVETPYEADASVSTNLLLVKVANLKNLDLVKDRATGLACLRCAPKGYQADLEVGLAWAATQDLQAGDLIVAVGVAPTSAATVGSAAFHYTSCKSEVLQRLSEAEQAGTAVELRVARVCVARRTVPTPPSSRPATASANVGRRPSLDDSSRGPVWELTDSLKPHFDDLLPSPTASGRSSPIMDTSEEAESSASETDGEICASLASAPDIDDRLSTTLKSLAALSRSDARAYQLPPMASPVEGAAWRARTERLARKTSVARVQRQQSTASAHTPPPCWPSSAPELAAGRRL